ncbi:MAG: SH3-like domain-containing protein [Saprospiraceae bacterium]|nr:SH3-like domain-containing protein [Saprospiraceae bacterium]
MQNIKFALFFLIVLAAAACNSKPKVIEAEPAAGQGATTPIFQDAPSVAVSPGSAAPAQDATPHKIVAAEALNTDKYTYIRVQENDEEYWIAIAKRDIKVGNTYFYRGGLMKKNFQSKEFNRIFETVYLVGDFWEEGAASTAAAGGIPPASASLEPPKNLTPAPGAIKISELVAHLSKYDGKTVKITGKCVKVNPMIMGKNWIHLQDGSGKNLDLTVTTTDMVQLGDIVTLQGTLALNKDFGAGYRYEYIVEGAVLK